jgi:DNA topoisomerase-1
MRSRKGKESKLQAMNEFYKPFIEKFLKVQDQMYKDPAQPTGEMCPVCGSPLVVKKSRYGSFIACSNYPKCKYIKKEPKVAPKETGEMCPECGKPLVERKDRKGNIFIACSAIPLAITSKARRQTPSEKKVYTEADWVKPCPQVQERPLGRQTWPQGRFPRLHQLPEMPLSRVDRR